MEEPKKEQPTWTAEEYWAWYNEKVYPHLLGLFARDATKTKEDDNERREKGPQ